VADFRLEDLKTKLRAQREAAGLQSLDAMRAGMEAVVARVRIDPRVTVTTGEIGHRACEWLRPEDARNGAAILYLHGGGFVAGSCTSHRPLASSLALASRRDICVLDYRLAPEHPWPNAEQDALAAYRDLWAQGFAAKDIAIVGDSAGGGLAVSTLLNARNEGFALPGCAVLFSPWVDLDLEGDSIVSRASVDPTTRADALARYALQYRGPTAGPHILYADLHGLPRILIQAGDDEILRDDSVRLDASLTAAGVESTLEIGPGLFHVWQAFGPWLQEAREAIARAAAFLNA
jgi:monoterpene epsilon-lactone hydrolase